MVMGTGGASSLLLCAVVNKYDMKHFVVPHIKVPPSWPKLSAGVDKVHIEQCKGGQRLGRGATGQV